MTDRIRLANDKIQGIPKDSTCYKILNAMLNGYNDTQFQGYGETRKIIVDDILNSKNLEELSQLYDDSFLVPMRARPSSATRRIQNQEDSNSDSSSFKSSAFMKMVRERHADKCVLTGDSDISTASVIRNLFEVAHFIPQSLLDNRKDSDVRKKAKRSIRDFIKRLCPWIPNNFFEQLDICENGILLNPIAHKYFDAFEWFVTMENGSDGNTTYRAMQVEENGLLNLKNTGRAEMQEFMGRDGSWKTIPIYVSSYNQPLYIGNSHPQPGEIYVRLHELLARIFKMRGQADYYQIDSDDEYEPLDNSEIIEKMASQRTDSS